MSIAPPEEQQLIRLARAGDNEAFDRLVLAHTPRLYRVVRRLAADPAETEAILQEAFWKAWRSLPRYREDRPFFPYLVTIALNVGRDLWRASRNVDLYDQETLAERWIPGDPDPEDLLLKSQELQALASAVAALPEMYRTVITLRYDAELSYEEIAEALKTPVNTVRTHIYRAKECLRRELRREDVGERTDGE
jgi:RNA polymerase sigma-70 factor (ECF subfamily)